MQFQKGQSGNPAGRPKGANTFAGLVRKKTVLANLFVNEAEERWPMIIKTIFGLAEKGDIKAISLIMDHVLIRTPSSADLEEKEFDEKNISKEEALAMIQKFREERDQLLPILLKKNKDKGLQFEDAIVRSFPHN